MEQCMGLCLKRLRRILGTDDVRFQKRNYLHGPRTLRRMLRRDGFWSSRWNWEGGYPACLGFLGVTVKDVKYRLGYLEGHIGRELEEVSVSCFAR